MKPFSSREIMSSLDREVRDSQRALAQRVGAAVVLATPIGRPDLWISPPPINYRPGTARGNWRAAVGRSPTSAEIPIQDPSGASTIAGIDGAVRLWDGFRTFTIGNAAGHIVPLDNGTASRQVSAGFVGRAVDAAVASLRRDRKELP